MTAFVRVSGPPNSSFLVGYPGISATLVSPSSISPCMSLITLCRPCQPRIEGKVEIRPLIGISAPVLVSLVTICLQRRESIHPSADSVTKRHLAAPRKDYADIVGKEMLLFRSHPSRENESVLSMDLPFVIFIPSDRAGVALPASLQLASRTAETVYELVVTVQQAHLDQRKYTFPVPLERYDTLSTFGMYNKPEAAEAVSDHIVTLAISLPRSSYGPLDPISLFVRIIPNQDWQAKARKVTIQKLTVGVEEEIVYNHEGDEPSRKSKTVARQSQAIGVKMPEAGYSSNMVLIFPDKDMRDSEGILPRGKQGLPMYSVSGFTTKATLYKIEYFLTIKVKLQENHYTKRRLTNLNQAAMSGAKDIVLRHPVVICPLDHAACKQEMDAIEQSAKDAAHISPNNPMLPAPSIVRANDPGGLRTLGVAMVGGHRKPLIE